ncbi:MAG: 16S rRNA (adenine(1518)-N(6)/adenine(1519)-N(6))-dimethyltransferase RsmA [Candidatus Staskawiczbacteria bacterium]|nr:16S rRNA (adenine(1518)-N(6)/adenine(1519)-N(6))-dimethyltransferase RsmA [Candidatus Staskawiczbacteria bacterium]
MNLLSPTIIKGLLAKYETRPSKGLGQNFLIDARVLEKIIEASDIKNTDVILEVGPGVGTLTQELAKKAGQVIAIEKDETMVKILNEVLAVQNVKNVKIVNDDILKIEKLEKFKNYKVIANIPYYLTSPLIRKFLEAEKQPDFMVLMIQKEVAQRICALPNAQGKQKMSLLAVSVQFYADAKIISYVSKNCFYPAPKIDSAIIKITPHINNDRGGVSPDLFFKIVKAGFSHPRKQLGSNLSGALKLDRSQTEKWLLDNNIKPIQRAETLSVGDWIKLASSLF